MMIATPIRTTTHANDPLRIRHLVVAPAERWAHFVRHGACYDHHVGLSRGGTEDYTETVLVVAGHGDLHHFDGAAGEAKA